MPEVEKMQGLQQLEANLNSVIRGKAAGIRLVLTALLAGGHVLLEDVPGTGKTTLAKALARSLNVEFRRIQFTPDLLPADITGGSYYNPADGRFIFRAGPVFANILLADEINRASPRTQSALLEVMSENQVTIEGARHPLAPPFFVIATQNSSDFQGTYPLPEAQLDRFAVRVTLGYPDLEEEIEILYSHNQVLPFERLAPVLTGAELLGLQAKVREVRVEKAIAEYLLRLVSFTRRDPRLRLSVSPRGSLIYYRMVQAQALLQSRDYATPEDVRALLVPVLAHRMLLDTRSKYSGLEPKQILQEALDATPVPR
jgi:MoxR-like ATPase